MPTYASKRPLNHHHDRLASPLAYCNLTLQDIKTAQQSATQKGNCIADKQTWLIISCPCAAGKGTNPRAYRGTAIWYLHLTSWFSVSSKRHGYPSAPLPRITNVFPYHWNNRTGCLRWIHLQMCLRQNSNTSVKKSKTIHTTGLRMLR
jgi:hypothetical protein